MRKEQDIFDELAILGEAEALSGWWRKRKFNHVVMNDCARYLYQYRNDLKGRRQHNDQGDVIDIFIDTLPVLTITNHLERSREGCIRQNNAADQKLDCEIGNQDALSG